MNYVHQYLEDRSTHDCIDEDSNHQVYLRGDWRFQAHLQDEAYTLSCNMMFKI